ncbi:MAG: hypothetical protein AN482_05865 [Anabaena sp. LE011-02]|jgi:HEAT repeat protein|nr:MAG: hypothetical protein AN482_05865 [Anabaena sp. LE011-02]
MTESITVTAPSEPINSAFTAMNALATSDDTSIKYYAAWWLGKNRVLEASSLLCVCLQDELDQTALGGYPLRRQAARSLGKLKDPNTVTALISALECSDPKVKEVVVIALKDIGNQAAIPVLIDLLYQEDKPIEALIEALTAFKVWEVQDEILPFLQHSSERIKCAAAQYFYTLTLNPYYLEILFQTLSHENRFVRYAAAFDISVLGRVETVPEILQAEISNSIKLLVLKRILESVLLDKAETEVKRQETANFLFKTIDELLMDAIEGTIHKVNSEVANQEVENIMALVAQYNTNSQQVCEQTISTLIEALKSRDPKVKVSAINGLVQLAPASVDTIIDIFDTDGDQEFIAGLIQTLAYIGDPRTLSLLVEVIGYEVANHCQGKFRRVAVRGLGKIARQATQSEILFPAIEKLKWSLLEPEDWGLRYSAIVALEYIGSSDTIKVLQTGSERESDLIVQTRIERAIAAIA